MTVVSFASPKGGAGKSTSALLLATAVARSGTSVAIIDADPNGAQVDWAQMAGPVENLTVLADSKEDTIIDTVERVAATADLTIVDIAGAAQMLASDVMSRSDLVIIPIQASFLDAKQASRAISMIQLIEKRFRMSIPYALLLTRVSPAITTREQKSIEAQLAEGQVPVLRTALNERAAFKSMFSMGKTIWTLDPKYVSGLEKAQANAEEFTADVLQKLSEGADK